MSQVHNKQKSTVDLTDPTIAKQYISKPLTAGKDKEGVSYVGKIIHNISKKITTTLNQIRDMFGEHGWIDDKKIQKALTDKISDLTAKVTGPSGFDVSKLKDDQKILFAQSRRQFFSDIKKTIIEMEKTCNKLGKYDDSESIKTMKKDLKGLEEAAEHKIQLMEHAIKTLHAKISHVKDRTIPRHPDTESQKTSIQAQTKKTASQAHQPLKTASQSSVKQQGKLESQSIPKEVHQPTDFTHAKTDFSKGKEVKSAPKVVKDEIEAPKLPQKKTATSEKSLVTKKIAHKVPVTKGEALYSGPQKLVQKIIQKKFEESQRPGVRSAGIKVGEDAAKKTTQPKIKQKLLENTLNEGERQIGPRIDTKVEYRAFPILEHATKQRLERLDKVFKSFIVSAINAGVLEDKAMSKMKKSEEYKALVKFMGGESTIQDAGKMFVDASLELVEIGLVHAGKARWKDDEQTGIIVNDEYPKLRKAHAKAVEAYDSLMELDVSGDDEVIIEVDDEISFDQDDEVRVEELADEEPTGKSVEENKNEQPRNKNYERSGMKRAYEKFQAQKQAERSAKKEATLAKEASSSKKASVDEAKLAEQGAIDRKTELKNIGEEIKSRPKAPTEKLSKVIQEKSELYYGDYNETLSKQDKELKKIGPKTPPEGLNRLNVDNALLKSTSELADKVIFTIEDAYRTNEFEKGLGGVLGSWHDDNVALNGILNYFKGINKKITKREAKGSQAVAQSLDVDLMRTHAHRAIALIQKGFESQKFAVPSHFKKNIADIEDRAADVGNIERERPRGISARLGEKVREAINLAYKTEGFKDRISLPVHDRLVKNRDSVEAYALNGPVGAAEIDKVLNEATEIFELIENGNPKSSDHPEVLENLMAVMIEVEALKASLEKLK